MSHDKIDRMSDAAYKTGQELDFYQQLDRYIGNSVGSNVEKFQNFPKYVPRQFLTYFLAKYEIFKKVLHVHGNIVECEVFLGGGLMSFAQFSAILEPVNHQRQVVGFDTFRGFPSLGEKDRGGYENKNMQVGALATSAEADIREAARLFDMNRSIGHMPKVKLVPGDATKTIPDYLEKNQHLVVSLLYLDFDLYEPTVVALKTFVPRMPKGAVIVFDELNNEPWPGETLAVLGEIGIRNLRIERFPWESCISYAVIE